MAAGRASRAFSPKSPNMQGSPSLLMPSALPPPDMMEEYAGPGSPLSPSASSLASEAFLEQGYNELIMKRRNSGSFLQHSPTTAAQIKNLGDHDTFLDVHQKIIRAASREAHRPESRAVPSLVGGQDAPSGAEPEVDFGKLPRAARARMLTGVSSLPTLGRLRLPEEVGVEEEGTPLSSSRDLVVVQQEEAAWHPGRMPRPEPPKVAPVFRMAESFLPEPSFKEKRQEDVTSYHKELLASEVGPTTVLPRAPAPAMPTHLDRKELSAKTRGKYPLRDWHPQAARAPTEAMEYYSVRRQETWNMPSRGTAANPRRVRALRPWDERLAQALSKER